MENPANASLTTFRRALAVWIAVRPQREFTPGLTCGQALSDCSVIWDKNSLKLGGSLRRPTAVRVHFYLSCFLSFASVISSDTLTACSNNSQRSHRCLSHLIRTRVYTLFPLSVAAHD